MSTINKIVPFQIDYKMVNKISSFASLFLSLAAITSLAILFVDCISIVENKKNLLSIFTGTLSVFAVLYFIFDVFQNYLFQQVELNRKNDFIDNSLKTDLADNNSEGYFSNDEIEAGTFKLGVNGFENSLFTKTILGKMLPPMLIKCLLVIILYLCVAIFTYQSEFAIMLQILLPYTIIQKTIRMSVLYYQVKYVFNQFKNVFSSAVESKRDSLLVHNVINYETALAWAGILINQKLFNKLNPELTQEWEKLKKRYNIK